MHTFIVKKTDTLHLGLNNQMEKLIKKELFIWTSVMRWMTYQTIQSGREIFKIIPVNKDDGKSPRG